MTENPDSLDDAELEAADTAFMTEGLPRPYGEDFDGVQDDLEDENDN